MENQHSKIIFTYGSAFLTPILTEKPRDLINVFSRGTFVGFYSGIYRVK
ncbi:hypothetical protein ES332_A02G172500v1 [Gossypium tomentosum]|uniref:Uncharacterized protein n=1 Tax=Gossypium tomentosum TaxID=34277 RepID=A0A5D2RJE5_GOSTO|nr:hypothetical protein ES332_A02G172500v1 [Gossypium tomentosum]